MFFSENYIVKIRLDLKIIACCLFFQHFVQQALEESGIGTIQELKDFYVNDVVNYYRQTYKKVSRLYEEHKAAKLSAMDTEPNSAYSSNAPTSHGYGNAKSNGDESFLKTDQELQIEQFMKENDL